MRSSRLCESAGWAALDKQGERAGDLGELLYS
jgi:hypothetical protein